MDGSYSEGQPGPCRKSFRSRYRSAARWSVAWAPAIPLWLFFAHAAAQTEPPQREDPQPPTTQAQAGTPKPQERPSIQPKSGGERVEDRERMVNRQIEFPRDRPQVKDAEVLVAMRAVPRHAFVPNHSRDMAYADSPLPIGEGQTISQPYIVALMTDLLDVAPDSKILEIGTGSGYQAAVLAHLTRQVYSMEIIEKLADSAGKTLEEQGYTEVTCRKGDGYHGWPEHAPYDGIIVTCAAGHLPPPLWGQLAPGGRIVIPIGSPKEVQRLVVVEKDANGGRTSRTIMPVNFVPLTRGDGK